MLGSDRRDPSGSAAHPVRRALEVIRVGWSHVVRPVLFERDAPGRARRAQAALESLGGAWIKLGQALALRFDLLPADYCLQFFQLLNQVRPFPRDEVRRVVEQELRQPVERLFKTFDWDPLAAASIGQVHRAELLDGTPVAVKVQRPGVREVVRADLRVMRWMATLVDAVPYVGRIQARRFVREFARWTEEELDYRTEARHASLLRENAADEPIEHIPMVFGEYTTSRVLTLEFLDGIAVIDIVNAIRRGDASFLEEFARRGHDLQRIASRIVWNGLNQIYRFGCFHADPHPANVIVLPGDVIGYVDFGIIGKLDERMTSLLRYFAQSLFAGHVGKAVDELMHLMTPSEGTDPVAVRLDLIEALENYLESERVGPGRFGRSENVFEIEMLAIVRRHRMSLAPDAVRYLKAVLTTESTVRELDPKFDLHAHENRFFGRLMEIEMAEALSPRHVAQWILDARFQLGRLLESVEVVRETPVQLIAATRRVQRRVRFLSLFTIVGWVMMLTLLAASAADYGATGDGSWLRAVGLAGGIAGVVLLVLLLVEVRRLPGDSGREPPYR